MDKLELIGIFSISASLIFVAMQLKQQEDLLQFELRNCKLSCLHSLVRFAGHCKRLFGRFPSFDFFRLVTRPPVPLECFRRAIDLSRHSEIPELHLVPSGRGLPLI